MNDDQGRFLRVYFDRLERDAPDVWYDPTCLSTFVRLLALSEKAWPSMPEIPVSCRRADLAKLRAADMIEHLPNHRYALRGWVKEREKRARVARENVSQRTDRVTTVPTTVDTTVDTVVPHSVLPVRARPSFSSSVDVTTEGVQGEPDAAVAFQARTGDFPGQKIVGWLNELSEAHGEQRLVDMIAATPMVGRKVPDYLRAVRDALRAADHTAERAERAAEKATVAAKRRPILVKPTPDDVTDADASRIAAEFIAATKGATA